MRRRYYRSANSDLEVQVKPSAGLPEQHLRINVYGEPIHRSICLTDRLGNYRAEALTRQQAGNVVTHQVKHADRQLVLHAERDCS